MFILQPPVIYQNILIFLFLVAKDVSMKQASASGLSPACTVKRFSYRMSLESASDETHGV